MLQRNRCRFHNLPHKSKLHKSLFRICPKQTRRAKYQFCALVRAITFEYKRRILNFVETMGPILGRLTAFIAVSGIIATASADQLKDALAAYNRGDFAVAVRLLHPLADGGNSAAEIRLGQMYWNGQGVEQDFSMAARLYLSAALRGDSEAQVLLGQLYFEGVGVPQNDGEAAKWFRAAAEQDVTSAESILAYMYRNGRGVKQSDVDAAKWFRKAADKGDANAQWRLGDLYRLGQGVPQDFVLAHMWFNLSAARGEQTAIVLRELVAKLMTREQIAEAQKLARDWKPDPASQD